MKKIKKLLYLLQLEEYDVVRFQSWLSKNEIGQLEERKSALKWTPRISFVFISSLLLFLFLSEEKAVASASKFVTPLFSLIEELLALLAKIKLSLYPKLIKIVITGSYGKTTFKEMLSWVLKEKYEILSTSGNVNTKIGIAQTIIKNLGSRHEILIMEAGAYQKGEIRRICEMIQPQFGIITIIGWMHLERFGTIENIRSAKTELADFIQDKANLFLPLKNHEILDFQKTIEKIAVKLGMTQKEIDKRLKSFVPPENRLSEKKIRKSLTIIEDNYNANPLGFRKALALLEKKYKSWQKIIISAGMIELGKMQFELNKEIAGEAAKIANILVIVGETNKEALLQGAMKAKKEKIVWIPKQKYSDEAVSPYLRPPSVILKENDFLPDNYF